MSATSPSTAREPQLYDCNWCEEAYPPREEYTDGFCSSRCKYRKDADDVLATLRHDHRYCSTCYAKLRDVYPPGRHAHSSKVVGDPEDEIASMSEIPDCAIGRAYSTPGTERGTAEDFMGTYDAYDGWSVVPQGERRRMVCGECGVTHHGTVYRPLSVSLAQDAVANLDQALTDLLSEESIEYQHDSAVLTRELARPLVTVSQETIRDALARAIRAYAPTKR